MKERNELVSSLKKDPAEIILGDREKDLVHLALGLAGEMAEVLECVHQGDNDHLCEEIGDTMWYVRNLCLVLGTTVEDCAQSNDRLQSCNGVDLGIHGTVAAGLVVDLIKKFAINGHALRHEQVKAALSKVIASLSMMACVAGSSLAEVEEANSAKLLKRFGGDSYSDQASIARVDVQ